MATSEARAGETVELLQTMIRNACVNDGSPDSGQEIRNATLRSTARSGAAGRSTC